ncbi:39S ribosomal protein L22, mitochondrial-like [Ostrea edulis]|uniref:39S ribosomal protein L22, mitochondrial-like n=1 Tax=Ostrea edulis TaxID=37623 RepID=UPI00209584E5|nr:39S ribosomal protein L22, mitochondrial-like [Ostrea edulis]
MHCLRTLRNFSNLLQRASTSWPAVLHSFHSCPVINASYNPEADPAYSYIYQSQNKSNFQEYNKIIYPPQPPEEPQRPVEYFHETRDLRYSPKKMWKFTAMVRGLSVDDAIKKVSFLPHKGAKILKQCLLEGQNIAVKEHGIEYPSNMWIEHAYCNRGKIVKGMRLAYKFPAEIKTRYCHLYIVFREGSPPKLYYPPDDMTGYEKIEDYVDRQRKRRILYSL